MHAEKPATMRDPLQLDAGPTPNEDSADLDPPHEIARLEGRIEDLSEALARCRKISLASKVAIATGAIWIAAAIIGAVEMDPLPLLAAIAAIIGGTVVFGSNTTTAKQISAAIGAAEARRAELIGHLDLRLVGGRPEH
jgi:hypothetical protein